MSKALTKARADARYWREAHSRVYAEYQAYKQAVRDIVSHLKVSIRVTRLEALGEGFLRHAHVEPGNDAVRAAVEAEEAVRHD